jgi:hypothetical protein
MTTAEVLKELTVIGKSFKQKAAGSVHSEYWLPLRACRVAYACVRNGANQQDILRGLRVNIPTGPELKLLDQLIKKTRRSK